MRHKNKFPIQSNNSVNPRIGSHHRKLSENPRVYRNLRRCGFIYVRENESVDWVRRRDLSKQGKTFSYSEAEEHILKPWKTINFHENLKICKKINLWKRPYPWSVRDKNKNVGCLSAVQTDNQQTKNKQSCSFIMTYFGSSVHSDPKYHHERMFFLHQIKLDWKSRCFNYCFANLFAVANNYH